MNPGDRERLLVEAARADEPPSGARERVLGALGVSAAVGLASVPSAAATGGAAKAASTGLLLKALAIGALVGTGGMVVASRWAEPSPGASAPASGSASSTARVMESAPPPEASALPLPSAPLPSTQDRGEPPRALPPRASVSATAPSAALSAAPAPLRAEQVAAERVLLDNARAALDAGRASTAVKALGEYDQRFGFGILGHEAVALRVKALLALGRRGEAEQVGQRYLGSSPHGTQAATVRLLLGLPDPAATNLPPPSDHSSKGRP